MDLQLQPFPLQIFYGEQQAAAPPTKFNDNRPHPPKALLLSLTQAQVNPALFLTTPPLAVLLQAGQASHTREAQLPVDEEEEHSQQYHKDPHRRQEADGLGGDWGTVKSLDQSTYTHTHIHGT